MNRENSSFQTVERKLEYDATSYILDGKRIWLSCGEMHYFRTPAALWPDRLLKAKRAGLNCISTYMAWNMHESSEGIFDFDGDLDIVAFIRLAGEYGLYVILRPGPYICSEWDFGGLPAWLTLKEGMLYRTNEPSFTACYKRFFAHALPPLAELDATRGGNIVLIQNENEHLMSKVPGRLDYFRDIDEVFREAGFRIPIINCNRFVDRESTGTIECVNTWDDPIGDLLYMRRHQPDAPLLVTEFWAGGLDSWGRGHVCKSTVDVVRKSIEILGCGSQNTYYMWHGGTNFAFWGGRLQYDPFFHIITSYDMDAPLAEGGELTPKYYGTRLVTMLANSMGAFFADKRLRPDEIVTDGETAILTIGDEHSGWITATRGARRGMSQLDIKLPNGQELLVPLEPYGAVIVPYGLSLADTVQLDYTNLMPFGWFSSILVLHGPPLWEAVVCVNGVEHRASVPSGDEPVLLRLGTVLVVILSTSCAERTWQVEDSIFIGPAFVGNGRGDIRLDEGTTGYYEIQLNGRLIRHHALEEPEDRNRMKALENWERVGICTEPFGLAQENEWRLIDGPAGLTELGVPYGYGWYKIELESERERELMVRMPQCEDRVTLYVNGEKAGVWGYGEGASSSLIPLCLREGRNLIVALADNLGRMTHSWRIGEPKGIVRHLYESAQIALSGPEWGTPVFDKRWILGMPGHLNQDHRLPELETTRLHAAELTFELEEVCDVQLTFSAECPVLVKCNGMFIGFYENPGKGFGDVLVPPKHLARHNRIELLLWSELNDCVLNTLKTVQAFALTDAVTSKARWSFSPWLEQPPASGKSDGAVEQHPAWFRTEFGRWTPEGPVYLRLDQGWKGQIYFNGRNVGRYWNITPQRDYYLPECWFQSRNTLMLFDEAGQAPTGAVLVDRRRWSQTEMCELALDVVPGREADR